MNYFYLLFLIIEALSFIELKCEDSIIFRNGDPKNFIEGYTYERFNFFTESTVDDMNVNIELNRNISTNDHTSNLPNSELLDSICLDEISADVYNSYGLTGVRFSRLNNTLMLQIQQAKICKSRIILDTLHWKPLPEKCNKIGQITDSKFTLILDDIILPGWMAVTGVTFKRYSDLSKYEQKYPEVLEKDPFFLVVIGHGLGYKKLTTYMRGETTVWNYSLKNRTNLINDDMDVPTALMPSLRNQVLSEPGKNYVTFTLTKPKQGLRQYVIPYIDLQNVTDPRNTQFVRGIGLYYKGYEGYGGYIALSIFVPEYDDCSNNKF